MVIFAALFILFGYVFLPRIKDFLQEDVLPMLLRQFSANQNVNRPIRRNMEAGEGVEPPTPPTSSPRAGGTEFEVFLSFRGVDTRKGFTGHLHDGLKERGISTFIDSEKLEEGEEINKLLEYIERSKIFVPIFSTRFAESKWCLKEVTKSVESRKEIFPVFFGVEPSDVRNQTGPFENAFKDHQSNKQQDQEEVRKWREALEKVGNLTGFTLKDKNGDEAKLKRAVIEKVSAKLNKKPFEVAKHPIGIETRVDEVKKMLEKGGNVNGVHVVGIHGMGGLGKTTIAKAVYNELAQGFNGATCFISNVRENAGQHNGLVNLQKKFIEDILKEKNISLGDVDQGKNVIKNNASGKRILLILDDVDSGEQLDALAGGRDWFGSGSVIIITTRDEEVLLAHAVKQDEIYKPQELNEDQSRELFVLHAFNGEQPQGEYVLLSNQVVAAAGGLPLTLKVMGSLLSSKKNVQEWKYTLEKLKKIPPREVQQRLKLSYDSLDDAEKKIFLDIACFFVGKNRENATYMWEGCDWFPNAAITVLVRRSLLQMRVIDEMDDKYEVFEMHDQIRDMGRAIVNEECSGKLHKKSRLWNNQDSTDLLQRKGPGTIDAEEILMGGKPFDENYCVSAKCFESMPNLRYLQARDVKFQGTFPCFPTDLRWLRLERCHFDSLPSDFNLEKLVIIDLFNTNMAPILINQLSLRSKAFERLKVLSLSCVETEITFDFTNMPCLVKLQFMDCSALTTFDESIGKLEKLTHLSIRNCKRLQKLPDSIWGLSLLEVLNIGGCSNFSSLSERLGELGALKMLDLSSTHIKKLPDSICQLGSLEMLCFRGCFELCSIPEGLGDMESLKKIDLSDTCIEAIPDSIGQRTDLEQLSLCSLVKLRELPGFICQLKLLKSLDLSKCSSLCSLPERLGDMEKLEELILDHTNIEIIPDSVGQLKSLRLLSLQDCKLLKALPISIRQLGSLQALKISGTCLNCSEKDLPHVTTIIFTEFTGSSSELLGLSDQTHKALEILHLKDATMEELPDCVGKMENLKKLQLECEMLKVLPDCVGRMEKLMELRLECEMLKELPNWIEGHLENLTRLKVSIMHLKALPDCIGSLKHLRKLSLECENLNTLPNSIGSLKRMKMLELYCVNLESLPDSIGELENLEDFEIISAKLKALPNRIALLGSVRWLKLHCMSLEALPDSIGHLKELLTFEVLSNSLEALPHSIGSLKRVWRLKLKCPDLEILPYSIGELDNLEHFEVYSHRLKYLPNSVGLLKHAGQLKLKCPNLEILPDCIGGLESLTHFKVDSHHLKHLPNSIGSFKHLGKLKLKCPNLDILPDCIGELESLTHFKVDSHHLKHLPNSIGSFKHLGKLKLKCPNLEILPYCIGELENLTHFTVLSRLLKHLPNSIGSLTRISWLELNCINLEDLPNSIERLQGLQTLVLHCDDFAVPHDFIGQLEKLENFSFGSNKLKYLDAVTIESFGRLHKLYLSGCEKLEGMIGASIQQTGLARLTSLESLGLLHCKGLEYLPQLPSSLCSLDASGCTNLRKMPDISNLKTLKDLCLRGCKQLEDVPGLEIISSNLKVLELPGPCDFTGCCHFSPDFKNKVFKEMTFENLEEFSMSGSLVPGSAEGQQVLQFILPRLPFSWLRGAWLRLGVDKVLSPICIAIIADEVTVFEKIVEVHSDEVELNLSKESIVKTGEGAHCYTMQVTMDVSQLQKVFIRLSKSPWYYLDW